MQITPQQLNDRPPVDCLQAQGAGTLSSQGPSALEFSSQHTSKGLKGRPLILMTLAERNPKTNASQRKDLNVTLTIPTIDCSSQDPIAALAELRRKLSPQGDIVSEAGKQRTIALFGEPLAPRQVVQRICADVRDRGLDALLDYTAKLDQKQLTRESMRVTAEELAEAHASADPKFLRTLRTIIANITEFQSRILHEDVRLIRQDGTSRVELRQRYLPLKRVGICVPGGAAAYPSTVLMTAVPAKTAGVKEIAVVVPPTDFGGYNTSLLATCAELKPSRRWRTVSKDYHASTKSSGREICSWLSPSSMCLAKSTSTASPGPAKWYCSPMIPPTHGTSQPI
jgi:hypothetical protein